MEIDLFGWKIGREQDKPVIEELITRYKIPIEELCRRFNLHYEDVSGVDMQGHNLILTLKKRGEYDE